MVGNPRDLGQRPWRMVFVVKGQFMWGKPGASGTGFPASYGGLGGEFEGRAVNSEQ